MRFFVTLGLLLLGIFYGFRSCSQKISPSAEKPPASHSADSEPSKSFSVSSLLPGSSVTPVSDSSADSVVADELPDELPEGPAVVVRTYRFLRRPVPDQPLLATMASDSIGISVDPGSNSVIVRGVDHSVASVIGSFSALDIEAEEAFVDAWMLFVRGDKVQDFEAGLGWSEGGFDVSGSMSLSNDGFGVALPLGSLRASLTWLSSRGVVEVVDRPQLRLSNGTTSTVSTGDEIPFPTTTFQNGFSSTSIEFKRVGLSFEVTPLFLTGGRVRMNVLAENGLVGALQKVGNVEVPSISRQSVRSSATLGYDEAMVIGGLESVRRERRFGILGESSKLQTGRLYVCLMLRSGYPKASPVIGPGADLGIDVPGVHGNPDEFLGGGLLPPLGWSLEQLDAEIDRVETDIRQRTGHPSK